MTDQKDKLEITYVPSDSDENSQKTDSHDHKHHRDKGHKKQIEEKKVQEKLKRQAEILKKVVKEREELKDKYLRTLAEMDNFRKRIKKEKEEYYKFALSEFLFSLLPIIDNLERALNSKSPANSEQSIISGIKMIFKQLLDLLKKNEVKEIEALGKSFDPNIHQALSKEEKEGIKEPTVVEVYQKGYSYQGRLLRPSLIKVAIPIPGDQTVKEEK
jgi:molecular chaperone GrpE